MPLDIETILVRYNPWWEEKFEPPGIKRRTYLEKLNNNLKNKQIIFITGLRRIGKTTIIKQEISELISSGINPKEIFFVSLDDPALVNTSLPDLVEMFRKINLLEFEKKIYLFFDEISYKEGFSQELKSLNDSQNVKIFASGSNALELMDKKAFLTGRVFSLRIYPLNFEEFLEFKKIKLTAKNKHLEQKYFEEFLRIGGVPEYVLTGDSDYINTLIEDIIYKDIARAYGIKNTDKLKEIFILLCERVGKKISFNKLSKIAGLDKETVAEYISHFQKTFLFTLVQRYSKSLNERIYSDKKVYISDNGIRNIFVNYKDKGSLFENLAFNELTKEFKDVFYYYENNIEIDFIIKLSLKKLVAVECKFNDSAEIEKYTNKELKTEIIKNYRELQNLIKNLNKA